MAAVRRLAGPLLGGLPGGWVALAALLALIAVPGPAEAQALRFTRPLDVTEAGWVRVPLGPEMLRRTSTGGGFRLFGPEGEEVPFRRMAARTAPLRRPVEPGAPVATDGGWWVPLDVVPGARLHERLLLETGAAVAAIEGEEDGSGIGVRVEGSDDGESWRLLVAGELVAVEGAEARYAVSYPATELHRLRLFWPSTGEGSEPPRFVGAAVAEVPPGSSRLSLARPECRADEPSPSGTRTVCRLPLGGAGRYLRHLCLLVSSTGPSAYRLLDAEEGRWETVAEGVWDLPGDDVPRCLRVALQLTGGSAEAEALRLELHGGGDEAPLVREASAELAPEELVFRARRAGLHTLAYGPAVLAGPAAEGTPPRRAIPPPSQTARIAPGPEEATEVPVPPIAFGTGAATAPAPAVAWRETWSVSAEAPEPDRLFRLTLPEPVYAVARPGLPDLRLLRLGEEAESVDGGRGGRAAGQVPFARWRPEAPELAGARGGVTPRADGELRRATLEPSARGLPLSALVATTLPPGDGFRWRVRVRYVGVADALAAAREPEDGGEDDGDAQGALTGGDDSTRGVGPWVEWVCRPRPPLPCRVVLALDEIPARRVVLEIDDLGEAPPPALDLELWRRRDVLLFAWPGAGGAPLLAAGAEGVEAPESEVEGGLDALLARPWQEAVLGTEAEGATGSGRLGRWVIGLALVVALAALLLLLDRILAQQAARPSVLKDAAARVERPDD